MFNSLCSKKGLTLVEVMIALMLTMIGVLAVISMQPQAWILTGKSDYLGRAAGILHQELEAVEGRIMNPCNPNPCSGANPLTTSATVRASGQGTAQPGDVDFTVQTTITDNGNNTWRVSVTVTWPGTSPGISESLVVTRQEHFRFPQGCV